MWMRLEWRERRGDSSGLASKGAMINKSFGNDWSTCIETDCFSLAPEDLRDFVNVQNRKSVTVVA